MSFSEYETSRYHGEPVDLYLFIYGEGADEYLGFADHEVQIVHDGYTYEPQPIMRSALASSGTLDKSGITITVDMDNPIADLFRFFPPVRPVTLIIRQGHIGDPDDEYSVIWSGKVLSCGWNADDEAELTCEPVSSALRRVALRSHFQYGCRHALYMGTSAGGCRASKADATRTATVVGINGAVVTLAEGWNGSFVKGKYLHGLVEVGNGAGTLISRAIMKINEGANSLTLTAGLGTVAVGDTVNVVLGCNHEMTDCSELHGNINDFGGQPWIPTQTPFGNTQNFY